ncbi:hypothetical protein Tco_0033763 [Tanacetum coccineum]
MIDFVPGRAMIDVAQHKCLKYEAMCAEIGYGFLPFSFSSFGELEKDAVTLLKRIQKFFMTQDIRARTAVYIFSRISFAIARGKSQMEDHTSDWLRVVPIFGLGQTMNGMTYRCVLCYRLGVPLFFVPKPCPACSRVYARDIYGEHYVLCVGIVDIKHQHNVVRATLVDICFWSGISAGIEVDIRLSDVRDKTLRPADMLLYSWMADFLPGRAVIDAAKRKCVKYEAKCTNIGYGFIPFLFSSFGELEEDVIDLLN